MAVEGIVQEKELKLPEEQGGGKEVAAPIKKYDGIHEQLLYDENEHLHFTNMALSNKVKELMEENSIMKQQEERSNLYKEEYNKIKVQLPILKFKAAEIVKQVMTLDAAKDEAFDVEEVHPIVINKTNVVISHSDWLSLTKNQPIYVMHLFLVLIAPAFDLDFDKYSYCLPRTNHLNAKNKVVLDEDDVKSIAEGARKHLSCIRNKCSDVKMVHKYIGRALSQLHQERLGELNESTASEEGVDDLEEDQE